MPSQNPAAISHPNTPAPWGPALAVIAFTLAALPHDQLQHLELVLTLTGGIGNLITQLMPTAEAKESRQ